MILLFLPMWQKQTGLVKEKPLKGQGDPAIFPHFTIKGWFSGEFQEKVNTATEETLGFRPTLIRVKNQLEYSLLGKANASGVVVGKGNYLFEQDYIRSYTGRDFLGNYYWEQKFERLLKVQDTLSRMGIRIAVILEPGKASSYPEQIPGRYRRFSGSSSNYDAIVREAGSRNIPLLDLNRLFALKRDSTGFPLFPKGGIHWSHAGMLFAADTILSFINESLRIPVADFQMGPPRFSDSLQDTDGDLSELMNLIFRPKHPDMSYPDWFLEDGDTSGNPRVLVISDSFFFNFLNAGIPAKSFANEAFWYYNQSVYPDSWTSPKDTSALDYRREVESMDLILIMVTERFYHRFDWDFTDRLFSFYYPEAEKEYRYDFMRDIIRNYLWFNDIQLESDFTSIPMERRLSDHADYLFWEANQAGRIPHDLDFYRANIRKDTTWMRQIREKARVNGITEEDQIRLDARWMMENRDQ